jgi:hypothetical protein
VQVGRSEDERDAAALQVRQHLLVDAQVGIDDPGLRVACRGLDELGAADLAGEKEAEGHLLAVEHRQRPGAAQVQVPPIPHVQHRVVPRLEPLHH